jgi:hypothetical protein
MYEFEGEIRVCVDIGGLAVEALFEGFDKAALVSPGNVQK